MKKTTWAIGIGDVGQAGAAEAPCALAICRDGGAGILCLHSLCVPVFVLWKGWRWWGSSKNRDDAMMTFSFSSGPFAVAAAAAVEPCVCVKRTPPAPPPHHTQRILKLVPTTTYTSHTTTATKACLGPFRRPRIAAASTRLSPSPSHPASVWNGQHKHQGQAVSLKPRPDCVRPPTQTTNKDHAAHRLPADGVGRPGARFAPQHCGGSTYLCASPTDRASDDFEGQGRPNGT